MKKFAKYAPWLIAGGAVVFAVATRQFYNSKLVLELPKVIVQGKTKFLLPTSEPFHYILKDGTKLAVTMVEAAKDVAVAAA